MQGIVTPRPAAEGMDTRVQSVLIPSSTCIDMVEMPGPTQYLKLLTSNTVGSSHGARGVRTGVVAAAERKESIRGSIMVVIFDCMAEGRQGIIGLYRGCILVWTRMAAGEGRQGLVDRSRETSLV